MWRLLQCCKVGSWPRAGTGAGRTLAAPGSGGRVLGRRTSLFSGRGASKVGGLPQVLRVLGPVVEPRLVPSQRRWGGFLLGWLWRHKLEG